MGNLYHGSSVSNLSELKTNESVHRKSYVYATPFKYISVVFSKRCGDDFVYYLGRHGKGAYDLVELVPGAFLKMFPNSGSIYTVDDSTFKDVHSGFCEYVSKENVPIVCEEFIPNIMDKLNELELQGYFNIWRYPNKPEYLSLDSDELINKMYKLKEKFGHDIDKSKFDRLLFLHPNLMQKINMVLNDFNIDYQYTEKDLISLFDVYVKKQIEKSKVEYYIENAYLMYKEYYPHLINEINEVLINNDYNIEREKTK